MLLGSAHCSSAVPHEEGQHIRRAGRGTRVPAATRRKDGGAAAERTVGADGERAEAPARRSEAPQGGEPAPEEDSSPTYAFFIQSTLLSTGTDRLFFFLGGY